MAHKKAAGAAKNLRDSQPKYRGIKLFGGQKAVAWNIIVRQNGSKYECGANTYLASDFSIHAATDGIVMFKQKNFKRFDGRTYLKTVVYVAPEAEKLEDRQDNLWLLFLGATTLDIFLLLYVGITYKSRYR